MFDPLNITDFQDRLIAVLEAHVPKGETCSCGVSIDYIDHLKAELRNYGLIRREEEASK